MSGLYGYPHEAVIRSKLSCLPGVLAPLQRLLLMADFLSFNQPLIVLERRKKKDEEEEEEESPRSLLSFPCVGRKKGGRGCRQHLWLLSSLLAAEPRGEEREAYGKEEEDFFYALGAAHKSLFIDMWSS